MNKEQIEKDLQFKNEELAKLQADILSETEKKQKEQLEKDIEELQKQLKELKDLETTSTVITTQEEIDTLKNDVEIDSDWTYELIQGTKMYEKLLTVLGDEAKVEMFATKIDAVVRKFLDQELDGFSNKIKNSMSVGIQFTMMETLIKQGADGSVEFFSTFSKTDTDNGSKNAFAGLYTSFEKFGSANKFYLLAKKVQNLTWYISDHKNIITSSGDIPQLVNPYQFKQLLTQNIWLNENVINTLEPSSVFTLDATNVDIHADEDKLREIINGELIEGVITEKSIGAIQKSLDTADKLLDRRSAFNDKAMDLLDKIAGILDINIPFLGNFGELVGLDFPTDLIASNSRKEKKGLINFILGIFGFRDGLQGLHRKYIQEKLDELDIDNTFIAAAYQDYQDNNDTTISNDSPTSTWNVCGLSVADTTTESAIKAKIPADYTSLKKSIFDNINENTLLQPHIIQKYAPAAVYEDGDELFVDTSKITETDIDSYLQDIIPKLVNSDFVTSDKVDQNAFILAVIGVLTGDKYFIEGVNIGLLTISDFKYTRNNLNSGEIFTYTSIEENDSELVRLSAGPNENYAENEKFKQYLHTLEAKNNLSYGIILNLMKAESGGKLYAADGITILGSSAGAKGLFQFISETAKRYIVKLGYPENDYEKIFTNPIIGAKACALFLKDCKEAGDDILNILAHYHAGPGVIGGQKVTVQNFNTLPRETQKYISKIGYNMLIYAGKSPIITQAQSIDPRLISTITLQQFFDAINSIPVPGEQKEYQRSSPRILAKNFDELALIGDSHAGGIKTMGGLTTEQTKHFYSFNGYDSAQLLEKIKQNKNQYIDSGIKSLILVVGTNDIIKNIVGQTKTNLEAIFNEIVPVQLVLSTVQYHADKTLVPDSKVDEVNSIIRDFAQEKSLPIIDINKNIDLVPSDYQSDQKHLTVSGYTKIVHEIKESLT